MMKLLGYFDAEEETDCEGCKWLRVSHEGLHCYMFKDKFKGCRLNNNEDETG